MRTPTLRSIEKLARKFESKCIDLSRWKKIARDSTGQRSIDANVEVKLLDRQVDFLAYTIAWRIVRWLDSGAPQ